MALAWGLLVTGGPALGADAPRAQGPTLQEAARPGTFCPLGGCRPAAASPWTAAAFGGVVLAIGWTARGRENG